MLLLEAASVVVLSEDVVIFRHSPDSCRNMEPPVKLGLEQGGYFAALPCLFQSELTVLSSAVSVCLPFGFIRADCRFKSVNGRRYFGFAELAFPDGDDIPFE